MPQLIHCQFCFPNCLYISDICILAIFHFLPQLVPWHGRAAALDWSAQPCLWVRFQACSWTDLELTPACGQELSCLVIRPLGPMAWLLHVSSLIHYSQQHKQVITYINSKLDTYSSYTCHVNNMNRIHNIKDHNHTINTNKILKL